NEERLLLAGRAIASLRSFARVLHVEIGRMRTNMRAARFTIANARRRKRVPEPVRFSRVLGESIYQSKMRATQGTFARPPVRQLSIQKGDDVKTRARDFASFLRHSVLKPAKPGGIAHPIAQQT